MEREMKISPSLVRRLRTDRGWSQEHLAIASGLSLRTIQRIEAEGIASMATRVSLAATFGIALAQLAEEAPVAAPGLAPAAPPFAQLLLGLSVLMGALLSESVRQVFYPGQVVTAQAMFAINLLMALVGGCLAAPAAYKLLRQGHYPGVALALLGMPPAVMLLGGLLIAALRAQAPTWPLLALGAGGLVLVAMGWRECARAARAQASRSGISWFSR